MKTFDFIQATISHNLKDPHSKALEFDCLSPRLAIVTQPPSAERDRERGEVCIKVEDMKELKRKKLRLPKILLLFGSFFIFGMALGESSFSQTRPPAVKTKPQPEIRQKLIIAQETDPSTMDAHYVIDSASASIMEHMVEPLLDLTPKGELVPKLAEKWEVSTDATEFTLKLRKGIKFHDGQPFNAEAVKVNFDRRIDPKAATKFYFLVAQIESVRVIDEYTVRIKTKVPFAPLLSLLTYPTNGIQSPAALKRSWDKPLVMPIGTGPFIFKEWVPGNRLVMVRNDNYWGMNPTLSEVTFRVIPDDASRVIALEKGEVHVAVQIPPSDIPRLKASPKIKIITTPSVKTIYMGFNCSKEPFTDKRIRQALNYAVNKEAIVEHVLSGVGRLSDAPISPGIFGYVPIKTYEFSAEKAKALLAEAGFPEGFETTLHIPTGRYYEDVAVASAVAADLLKVGVKAEIKRMDWDTYIPFIFKENEGAEHKLYLLGWSTVTGDADYGLYALFHSEEWPRKGMNVSFFKNEKVDQLLGAARGTASPGERKKLYKEAMTVIMEEAPWIFLYSETQVTGVRANVKDIVVHPIKSVIATQAKVD
jgi:peptide/nickel transport system substrate-binding protein